MTAVFNDPTIHNPIMEISKEQISVPIENQIKIRKWNWIGHTLRKEAEAIEKTALDLNPQGYRRRGRPRRMWRRKIKDEIRGTRRSWNEVKGIAGDRIDWKLFMDALCFTRSKMS
jgi:hypothetical protein